MSVKVLFVLFLCKALVLLVNGQLKLMEGPQSVSVNEKEEVVLACRFNGAAKECAWLKDNEVTIVGEPYHYVSTPESGDCSIRISQVDLGRDDGLWRCQYPRLGTSPAVVSQDAKVTVLVPPEEPVMYFNGNVVETGSTLPVEIPNDNITVTCISKNGNPTTQLHWMIDNERREGSSRNESLTSSTNGSNSRLFNIESQLQLSSGPHLKGTLVKCVAEHPTYKGATHETYGFFQVHHNTTQVSASVEGSASTNVEVNPDQKITLVCMADGVPTPSYMWSFQRRGVDTWEDLSNQQNVTVTASDGTFVCWARNAYNTDLVKSFEEIQVEIKENKVTANNEGQLSSYSALILVLSASLLNCLFIL